MPTYQLHLLGVTSALLATRLTAQPPSMEWQRSFGGSSSDNATVMEQTNDGGHILIGTTSSNDGAVHGSHGSEPVWNL